MDVVHTFTLERSKVIRMKFLDKMQRKFGKYAISNLVQYIIAIYLVGIVIYLINPMVYFKYLSLDFSMIMKGQLWRLVTFLCFPRGLDLFMIFELYLYYLLGSSLERNWGSFRFNVFIFSGIICEIIAMFIAYLALGNFSVYIMGDVLNYVYRTMFFAFAMLYPNMQMMLMFIIPIKIKYLAWIYAAIFAYSVVNSITSGLWPLAIAMVVAVANVIVFFLATRNYKRISPKEYKRRTNYKRQVRNAYNPDNVVQFRGRTAVTRHKCAVCGRTELDDENLEFRFCSKCDGNYEYCMDHLYTHEHVHQSHPEKES